MGRKDSEMKTDLKKLVMLIVAIVLYNNISVVVAGESEKELGISLDVTWVSKYIWRGQDLYDDHAAFQPSINFDLYGTGFSANIWTSYAGSSGFRDTEENNYSVTYSATAFDGQISQTDYAISWLYYDVYDAPTRDSDSQDIILDLSWPELLGGKVVPVYQLSYYFSAKGGGDIAAAQIEGFYHVFGLDYDVQIAEIENPLTLHWDIAYNDGQGGTDFDHDWSHMTWSVSTSFEDFFGATLTPALYYQTSMERSVNPEDEFWVGISYGFDF